MIKYTKKRIYDLLPAIYRQRDIETGSPLRALVDIIAEQIRIVEDNITRLYGDWFIETCNEWVIAYIADLIKAKIQYPVSDDTLSQRRRAWVANTIGYRRRKGTLAVLEQLARDVTGQNAKAVEFFELLITTQYLNHLRPTNLSTPDLRDMERLDRITTPFNTIAHTVDVRHIENLRGYYNIPNICIFLWRLQSLPAIDAPCFSLGGGKYCINSLGYEIPLFNHPNMEKGRWDMAEEINIGAPIRMQAMDKNLEDYYYSYSADLLSENQAPVLAEMQKPKSIQIKADNSIKSINDIVVCDLTDWAHRPHLNKVMIDPTRGRILFPKGASPTDVHTSHYYGFSGKVGGGFYVRPVFASDIVGVEKIYKISKTTHNEGTENDNNNISSAIYTSVNDAVKKWADDGKSNTIIEILDSEIYDEEEPILFEIPSDTKVIIRSRQERRPILRLSSPIKIKGKKGSSMIIDGLFFDVFKGKHDNNNDENNHSDKNNYNNNLLNVLQGDLHRLTIRHCSLVPGRNKNSEYDSRLLFDWNEILNNPDDIDSCKGFLDEYFSDIVKWIDNNDVNFEFMSESKLKIYSPSVTESFLTITRNDTNTVALLELNNNNNIAIDDDTNNSVSNGPKRTILYDFVLKEEGNKINVYNPKIGLLMAVDGIENDNIDNNNKNNNGLVVSIEKSICGRILIVNSEAKVDIKNSIVDAKASKNALTCYKSRLENCTILGSVSVVILELASNVLFTDVVMVKRRQLGCIRFSYLPPHGSLTPTRHHCQPEYFRATALSLDNDSSRDDDTSLNVFPRLTSIIFGEPGYCQLHRKTSNVIFEGADNGSEIGVFNDLFQVYRIKNLESCRDEYLRFGREAGIALAD
jgi:hypothetical protein